MGWGEPGLYPSTSEHGVISTPNLDKFGQSGIQVYKRRVTHPRIRQRAYVGSGSINTTWPPHPEVSDSVPSPAVSKVMSANCRRRGFSSISIFSA